MVDFAEIMAGEAEITNSFLEVWNFINLLPKSTLYASLQLQDGQVALKFDIEYSPKTMNLLTPAGFLHKAYFENLLNVVSFFLATECIWLF